MMSTDLSASARAILNDPTLIAARDRRMAELTKFFRDPNRPRTLRDIPIVAGDTAW